LANIPLVVFRLLFTSFYDIFITQRGCLTSKVMKHQVPRNAKKFLD